VGQQLDLGGGAEVVGVVSDVTLRSLSDARGRLRSRASCYAFRSDCDSERSLNMRCAVLFVLLVTSLSAATAGQERTLSGTWSLKAEAVNGTTEGGRTWSRSAFSGTLNIEQKDTALKGTWKGPQGDPWQFTGRVQGDKFEFRTDARGVPVTRDGHQTTEAMRWTFHGTIAGEGLTGTMALHRSDEDAQRPQPFTAERRR
jgi:hypothetical protein